MPCDFYVALHCDAVGWFAMSDHTHFFILIRSFKIQQKSGIRVIMQFLGHRIKVMLNIDQHSLVSRGWPCGDSYIELTA